jgi:hypothetical protein
MVTDNIFQNKSILILSLMEKDNLEQVNVKADSEE